MLWKPLKRHRKSALDSLPTYSVGIYADIILLLLGRVKSERYWIIYTISHISHPRSSAGESKKRTPPRSARKTSINVNIAAKALKNAREMIAIFSREVVGTGCPLTVNQLIFIFSIKVNATLVLFPGRNVVPVRRGIL